MQGNRFEQFSEAYKSESIESEEYFEGDIESREGSIASELHPERNEDAVFRDSKINAIGVFDGIGGHAAGEVASQLARGYIATALAELPKNFSAQEREEAFTRIFQEANERIMEGTKNNPESKGMGTTATVVQFLEEASGERKAIIGNVGDSRVYVLRANGELEQVTLDDNNVREFAQGDEQNAREIQSRLNNAVRLEDLSRGEQGLFNRRNALSQYLGMSGMQPRVESIDIHEGDKVIVTSDGIHDNLTDSEIAEILKNAEDNQEAVKELLTASRERSRDEEHLRAKADDMSAVIAEFPARGKKNIEQNIEPQEKHGDTILSIGEQVRVRRSSGEVETDWTITEFDKKTNEFIVQRKEGGDTLEKRVPRAKLQELNHIEKHGTISEARDFVELYEAIDATGGIQGSS